MQLKIITVPFSEATQLFHDELVEQFCINKHIYKMDVQFFVVSGIPYWTVALQFTPIVPERINLKAQKGKKEDAPFDAFQKVLFDRLKSWRKQAAEESGIPAYMVCTNQQLEQMIFQKSTTLEGLKLIKGFGKSRIEKHGKALVTLIGAFYEKER